MKQYLDCLSYVINNGDVRGDRTGTGTIGIFGYQMRFNLESGFPLITTKKIHTKSVIHELLWFLSGSTDVSYLQNNGVKIWDQWVDENGTIGSGYGKQWRSWGGSNGETYDQISDVINKIKTNPNSRRLIVSAWNVAEIELMQLPPCHTLFQFYVQNGKLSCQLYQRSADLFLGVPFNIASYAMLVHMVAQVCNLRVGDFIWTGGDVHIYLNHVNQVMLQLSRPPLPAPAIRLNSNIDNIFDFKYDDIEILNYQCHPAIKAPVAV